MNLSINNNTFLELIEQIEVLKHKDLQGDLTLLISGLTIWIAVYLVVFWALGWRKNDDKTFDLKRRIPCIMEATLLLSLQIPYILKEKFDIENPHANTSFERFNLLVTACYDLVDFVVHTMFNRMEANIFLHHSLTITACLTVFFQGAAGYAVMWASFTTNITCWV